jgi:hypothetical protein
MMKGPELLSSDVVQAMTETSKLMVQVTRSIHEAYRVSAQIAIALKPITFEATQRAQEMSRMISPELIEMAVNSARFANLISPAVRTLAESVYRFGIELQPLLQEIRDINLRPQQFANLYQALMLSTQEREFNDETAEEISCLSIKDKQDVIQAVNEILAEPENWEQVLEKTLQTAQNRHPILAKAIKWLLSVILAIVLSIAANSIYDVIKAVKLREAPSTNSPVVVTITPIQQVSVIGEAPYYFEIEYTDSETGETYTGWVSKRSVQKYEELSEVAPDEQ